MSTFQLYYNANSPFVRKVVIAARELGLRDRLVTKEIAVMPTVVNDVLNPVNPLALIPTLVTPIGSIFDSSVIVQYLDSLSSDPAVKVLPPAADFARYGALTYEAICDGILGAALLIRYENAIKSEEQRSAAWIDGQMGKLKRGVIHLGTVLPVPDASAKVLSLQGIALAVVFWYLDRRYKDIGWRNWEGGEKLDTWYKEVEKREAWKLEEVPPI